VPRHVAPLVVDNFAYIVRSGASVRRAARCRLLRLHRASGCLSTSRGSSSTTSPPTGSSSTTSSTPRVRVPRHVARLITCLVVDYFDYAVRLGASARRAARRAVHRQIHLRSRVQLPRHVAWLVTLFVVNFAYTTRPGASARRAARRAVRRQLRLRSRVRLPRLVAPFVVNFAYTTRPGPLARRAARCRLLRLRRASGCLSTSRGSSSTTSPPAGSSSTTSPTPRVRVPRHVARLVTRRVAPLVIDYFAYATCPVASARRAARHVARRRLLRLCRASGCLSTSRGSSRHSSTSSPTPRVPVPRHVTWLITPLVVDSFAYAVHLDASARRAARCRLLRLRCASGCLSTSRGSSSTTSPRVGSSSTTSPPPRVWVARHIARLVTQLVAPLVVDYFAYAARPGASARRAARHVARRRLLRLCRASGCLGMLRGSSRCLSSTLPTPRVQVPRHVVRLVMRLVVDCCVRRDFVLRPHWLYFSQAVHRDYLSRGNTGSTSSTSRTTATSSSSRIASTIHLD
jgi:hypothetical protein